MVKPQCSQFIIRSLGVDSTLGVGCLHMLVHKEPVLITIHSHGEDFDFMNS